jgi:hypothetical protein
MSDTPEKTFKPGDAVILLALPPGFIGDMDIEDREACSEAVGSPVIFNEYDDIGRAELQFTSRDGHIHFIYVEPKFIKAVDSENRS